MGKKYFCDYCQKHIQINPGIVKKHNEGIPHVRNKMAHYEKFKDPSEIINEESRKKPCRTLLTSSECTFGASCHYSHYRPEQLDHLSRQATWIDHQRLKRSNDSISKFQRAQEITQKFLERRAATSHAKESTEHRPFWAYPKDQRAVGLPPSLQEIDPARLGCETFAEWG